MALEAAYRLCWQVQAVSKLLSERPLTEDEIGTGGAVMLRRETGCDRADVLQARLEALCGAAAGVIETAIARGAGA